VKPVDVNTRRLRTLKGFNNNALTSIKPFQGLGLTYYLIPEFHSGLFTFDHFMVSCSF